MQDLSKINWGGKFLFIILALSLLLGFYLQEDASTGGATADFYLFIWKFTLALQENFFYTYNNWEEAHLPLHSIILASINFFANDEYLVRFIYCLISIIAPFIFYLSLKEKFSSINENLLIIFHLCEFCNLVLKTRSYGNKYSSIRSF